MTLPEFSFATLAASCCPGWRRIDTPRGGMECIQHPNRDTSKRNVATRLPASPVDRIVGEAIAAWEKIRPKGVTLSDPKIGELVDFLFLIRLTREGISYLNKTLIPTHCKKAGVPLADVRSNIASHRACSTIASQLYNARELMTLIELQEWLGHTTPTAAQHDAKITPMKVAKSYSDAGYFARNLRAIEVL